MGPFIMDSPRINQPLYMATPKCFHPLYRVKNLFPIWRILNAPFPPLMPPPSLPLPHSFSLHPSYISPPLPPPFKLLQISAVGELSRGSSLITFYILNGTDVTSDPTFVEAGLIDMAFRASNVQEVDSYPVSISGEDQTKSIK